MQTKNIQALQRPPDMPEFPLDKAKKFGDFEKWLENQENYNYMVMIYIMFLCIYNKL